MKAVRSVLAFEPVRGRVGQAVGRLSERSATAFFSGVRDSKVVFSDPPSFPECNSGMDVVLVPGCQW